MSGSGGLSRELLVYMKICSCATRFLQSRMEAAADKLSLCFSLFCSVCWRLQSKSSSVIRSRNSTNIPPGAAAVRCPTPSPSRLLTATAQVSEAQNTHGHTHAHLILITSLSRKLCWFRSRAAAEPRACGLGPASLLQRNINYESNSSAELNLLHLVLIRSASLSQTCQSLPTFIQTSKLGKNPTLVANSCNNKSRVINRVSNQSGVSVLR